MDFGMCYFIVKFDKSKKEELLGIARTHMSKFELAPPHDLIKTWHWTSLQSWNVNWEVYSSGGGGGLPYRAGMLTGRYTIRGGGGGQPTSLQSWNVNWEVYSFGGGGEGGQPNFCVFLG